MVHRVLVTVNNFPPVVTPATFSITTPATQGTVVGTVQASNSPTAWAITAGDPGSPNPFFAIDNLGVITVTASGATNMGNGTANLTVRATNAGGNGTATITVNYAPLVVSQQWSTLKVGAGGFIRGNDIHTDGTMLARADTFGAYVWDKPGGATAWRQAITVASLPVGDPMNAVAAATNTVSGASGVWAAAIAPGAGNSGIMYCWYGGYVYRTTNKGLNWTATSFTKDTISDPNGPLLPTTGGGPTANQKMAVDPANPNIVMLGTATKLWRTTNGGTTWLDITGLVPASTLGYLIAFDPTSTVVGNITQGIYVGVPGSGVYRSTNGASSFSATAGAPTAVSNMVCAQDGYVYACVGTVAQNLYIFNGATWSSVSVGTDNSHPCWAVAVDPANANIIVAGTDRGALTRSTNHGGAWSGYPTYPGQNLIATDIPYLATTSNEAITLCHLMFDPSQTNVLYVACGIGVFKNSPPSIDKISQSAGIEQLVNNVICCPPGGKPVIASWDRPLIYSNDPTVYPSTYSPLGSPSRDLAEGYSVNYATSNPLFMVASVGGGSFGTVFPQRSCYSSDGGQTWTSFAAYPAFGAGSIAATDTTHFAWALGNNGPLVVTANGGASWTTPVIAGVATSGEIGWGWAYYIDRHIIDADKVTPGTFYAYNYGGASTAGIYRSSDSGASWARVFTGTLGGGGTQYNARLRCMPGEAGNVFFTSGSVTPPPYPHLQAFYRSTNAGVSWNEVTHNGVTGSIKEVWCFGFGKAAAGQAHATIYFYGWLNGVAGIYQSIDNGVTWQLVPNSMFPNGNVNSVKYLEGDMSIFGRLYVGFLGSSCAVLM